MVFILRAIDAAVFRVFGWDKMTLLRPSLMMDGAPIVGSGAGAVRLLWKSVLNFQQRRLEVSAAAANDVA